MVHIIHNQLIIEDEAWVEDGQLPATGLLIPCLQRRGKPDDILIAQRLHVLDGTAVAVSQLCGRDDVVYALRKLQHRVVGQFLHALAVRHQTIELHLASYAPLFFLLLAVKPSAEALRVLPVVPLVAFLTHGIYQFLQFLLLLDILLGLVCVLGRAVAIGYVEIAEFVLYVLVHRIIPFPPVGRPKAYISYVTCCLHDGRIVGGGEADESDHGCYLGNAEGDGTQRDAVLAGHIGGSVAIHLHVQRHQAAVAGHAVHLEVGVEFLGDVMLLQVNAHLVLAGDDGVGRQACVEVVGENHCRATALQHIVQLVHLLCRYVGHSDLHVLLEGSCLGADGHVLAWMNTERTAMSRLLEGHVGVEGVQKLFVNLQGPCDLRLVLFFVVIIVIVLVFAWAGHKRHDGQQDHRQCTSAAQGGNKTFACHMYGS